MTLGCCTQRLTANLSIFGVNEVFQALNVYVPKAGLQVQEPEDAFVHEKELSHYFDRPEVIDDYQEDIKS